MPRSLSSTIGRRFSEPSLPAMLVRYWPSALTAAALPQERKTPDNVTALGLAVPFGITLVALFAAAGLLFEFWAASADLLALSGEPANASALRTAAPRSNELLDLWASLSFPVLSIVVGYALAASSHAEVTSADRLARLYLALSDVAAKAQPRKEVVEWARYVRDQVAQLDAARSALRDAAWSAWQVAQRGVDRASDPERDAGLARRIDSVFGFRRLIARLDTSTADGVASTSILSLQFVGPSDSFGSHAGQPLALQLLLFGEGAELVPSVVDIYLPAAGSSLQARVHLRRTAWQGRIRVLVVEHDAADILQDHEIVLA